MTDGADPDFDSVGGRMYRHVWIAGTIVAVWTAVGTSSAAQTARSRDTSHSASLAAATVGKTSVSVAELEVLASSRLVRLRAEEFSIKRRVLDERVEAILLKEESRRRGMSIEQLLKLEVNDKTRPVTGEEARAVLESSRDRVGGSEEGALALITTNMSRQRAAMRRAEYLMELRAREPIRILLEPPRVALHLTSGPSRGTETAPVTIVAFTDFQCPYCSRMAATLKLLEQRYEPNLRLVLKHFPMAIHKDAAPAAEAAACAEEQGRFWEMHDKLFADPNGLSVSHIQGYVRDLALDANRFSDCLASGRGAERVKRDRSEGEEHGVTNTPTFFVNGRYVLGALPLEAFVAIVDEELRDSLTRQK